MDWQIGVEGNNEDKVLVKKKWLKVRTMQMTKVVIEEIDLLEEIRKWKAKNNKVIKAVEKIE